MGRQSKKNDSKSQKRLSTARGGAKEGRSRLKRGIKNRNVLYLAPICSKREMSSGMGIQCHTRERGLEDTRKRSGDKWAQEGKVLVQVRVGRLYFTYAIYYLPSWSERRRAEWARMAPEYSGKIMELLGGRTNPL
jgi:hypothetical protein